MRRIEIINSQLADLKLKKVDAVGSDLRRINKRIVSMENVLLREMNYPRPGETSNNRNFEVIQGEKGEKGDMGLQGEPGIKGDKGDKGDTGADGQRGLRGEKGNNGNDIDPSILNAKLDFVQCPTFQDLPVMPVTAPTLAIVATDDTNDNTETVYLIFGSTRKLLVTVAG